MKISPELRDTFRCIGKVRNLAKKECVLEQGDVSRHAYFVESGCLRLWHNDEGKDVSLKFFLQEELCASLQSFHQELPSKYGLETIAPSVVRVCTKQDLRNFMEQSPAFREYVNSVMVHCMTNYQNLFADRISNSPEDRYQVLIEREPEVLNTVPLHYIASYLGIAHVMEKVGSGKIRAVIDRGLPMKDIISGFEHLASGRAKGKFVLLREDV